MAPRSQRQRWVGHDQLGVDALLQAQATAFRAGAEGIVEGEQPRLDLGDGEAGHRAGELRGEGDPLRLSAFLVGFAGVLGHGDAVGEFKRGLQALGVARALVVLHRDAVDHDVDVVLQLLVEHRRVGDLVKSAIDLERWKPFFM